MITGYKKQRLGKPSEKLSGDVPRAGWRAVIVSEIVSPVAMAVILPIAYMFVKSFPDIDGKQPASPLVRLAVIAIGPIVWNAGVLLAQFIVSLFLGPMLGANFPRFGAFMAFIVHIFGTVGMVAFFEFLVSRLVYNRGRSLTLLDVVVPRTLELCARGSGPYRSCRHPTRDSQDPHLCFPLS
jgi:1,3-beta-glucan synthase